MKQVSLIVGSAILTWVFMHSTAVYMADNTPQKEIESVQVFNCDSLHLANDSLSNEIELLQRRVLQYKIGLGFLKEKDKKSYQYVINAGNLQFKENYTESF